MQRLSRGQDNAAARAAEKTGRSASQSQAGQALGRSRGDLNTKIIATVADENTVIAVTVSPGQAHDAPLLVPALVQTRQRVPVIHELVGDKGFDSDDLRRVCLRRGMMPELAARSNRPDADLDAYRTRNRIERFFAKLKQFRRIVTCHDKLKTTFLGFLNLACSMIRFRQRTRHIR